MQFFNVLALAWKNKQSCAFFHVLLSISLISVLFKKLFLLVVLEITKSEYVDSAEMNQNSTM